MRPDNTALTDPQEMARMMDLKTGTEYVSKIGFVRIYMDSAKDADFICQIEDWLLHSSGRAQLRIY